MSNPNNLIHEKSPYLLQHAYNPVNWYPWGEKAFEKAHKEDKPIFLSIGYSTCHWCHVMEKESFENEEVAALLNKWFVCIKVDREERPDIDSVYMTVCQMVTGGGGWPLTIVMTPDKKPFFAATYIPRESRMGMRGLKDILVELHEVWTHKRGRVLDAANNMVSAVRTPVYHGEDITEKVFHNAYQALDRQFDEYYGGFGPAPKFPTPHRLLFLLRYWKTYNSEHSLNMVKKTLDALQLGGIYDHIGFGIHRYSTDQKWMVPHFEKMLYDQALVTLAYTEAYQATGDTQYKETVEHILQYVLRDMTSPEGGFYSAQDADTDGVEGKFYTWKKEEITSIVKDPDVVCTIFNVTEHGNFTEPETGLNKNIITMKKPLKQYAEDMDIPFKKLNKIIKKARKSLFESRESRIHPQTDDKILTDWNGLMVAALSKAGQIFKNQEFVTAAEKAAQFVIDTMYDSTLYHRYRDNETAISGFLDDYACFVWGLLELYETTFTVEYLETALELTEYMVDHFLDLQTGGFFQTSNTSEHVLNRQKQFYDGAIPSGNSVAMYILVRLARMTGFLKFEEMATQLVKAASQTIQYSPSALTFLLSAFNFVRGPSHEVVIVGDPAAKNTKTMIDAIRAPYTPNTVVIFKPHRPSDITSLCPFTADMTTINGNPTGYVCTNQSCQNPTTDISTVIEQIT
ncbi:MAG: thioredoxin domain-containing protein [Candidatus Methanofastidiosia archaeon]|jgi:uncharacterized protein YyaL (SSP411 family)